MFTYKRIFLLAFLLLVACAEDPAPNVDNTAVPPTLAPTVPPPPPTEALPTETAVPTNTPITPIDPADLSFPPPAALYPPLAQLPITADEARTSAELEGNLPFERDDIALARAYKGVIITADDNLVAGEPLTVGTIQQFSILNISNNTRSTVDAELKAVGEHAYFWFDLSAGNATPNDVQLDATAKSFDKIYGQVIGYFGAEDSPGVDQDVRVHVFNASPITICNVTVETAAQCGLLGYFSAADLLPTEVYAQSNEREMFVMNGSRFTTSGYLEVLAHEFRHMIEANHDRNDWDWAVEGSAMLAEDLLGYSADSYGRANTFLNNPDQQLNRWSESNTTPRYGQGYALNRYIFDRFGEDLYLEFAEHEAPGLDAVTAVAEANGLGFDGLQLWLDWLVALVIHNRPEVPVKYDMPEQLTTASAQRLFANPQTEQYTVHQYAADYYELLGDGEMIITFNGSTHTPLLDVQPASGSQMWVSNRANFSQARLTRPVDLTAVESATLYYDVYHDIEAGYDFAYLSVSVDGGESWEGLQAAGMQSQAAGDDPSESAWTPTFYTGQSGQWVTETADLTAYTGQQVHIRFEYITDPILTFGGLAIDNIAIPEIGYVDDAESETGWTAEGFSRATGYIPQNWHLQLVEFVDGVSVITPLELNNEQTTTLTVNLSNDTQNSPILIVAATAPMTLQTAQYQLTVDQP